MTALLNAASLAREAPAVYVVEDAHWIDPVSESTLGDFFMMTPQTPSLVLVTYRPEYRGALRQIAGAQTIALAGSERHRERRPCMGRRARKAPNCQVIGIQALRETNSKAVNVRQFVNVQGSSVS